MNTVKIAILMAGAAALLLLPGCASSPEADARRANMEADIDEIMSYELDPAEYGETKKCLSKHEYDSFRPLGDRHILFEGRRDKLWINTLRGRCHDLRHGNALVVKMNTVSRMCDMDRFAATEWFDYPRYPGAGGWGTGVPCSLGKFHPVTAAQVAEIESVLDSR